MISLSWDLDQYNQPQPEWPEETDKDQGICPNCDGDNLDYHARQEHNGGMIGYPWRCNVCGVQGVEWYNLYFVGHEKTNRWFFTNDD